MKESGPKSLLYLRAGPNGEFMITDEQPSDVTVDCEVLSLATWTYEQQSYPIGTPRLDVPQAKQLGNWQTVLVIFRGEWEHYKTVNKYVGLTWQQRQQRCILEVDTR